VPIESSRAAFGPVAQRKKKKKKKKKKINQHTQRGDGGQKKEKCNDANEIAFIENTSCDA
jgi:hypothetical protein